MKIKKWIKNGKPTEPCIFITRVKNSNLNYRYVVYELNFKFIIDCEELVFMNANDKSGHIHFDDFYASEYFIIEKLKK